MFEGILLEAEQKELLSVLVEAARNVPREQRQKFIVIKLYDRDEVVHPGFPGGPMKSYMGDIETLAKAELLNLSYQHTGRAFGGMPVFDVAPQGFAYYEQMKQAGEPVQRVEAEIRSYIDGQAFQEKYPAAYQKWAEAEKKLWGSESKRELTTIGHLCRETMQEFATALVDHYRPPRVDTDKKHNVARIKAVVNQHSQQLGGMVPPFLEELVAYWGTVSDLVQRQEHGAQRDGEPLVWEDARRVVFQTAMVMFEIDRSLASLK